MMREDQAPSVLREGYETLIFLRGDLDAPAKKQAIERSIAHHREEGLEDLDVHDAGERPRRGHAVVMQYRASNPQVRRVSTRLARDPDVMEHLTIQDLL